MTKPRLLANENIPGASIRLLRAAGLEVEAIAEHSAGLSDEAVLALAVREQRWLITLDRDYGELLFARGLPAPPAVLYLRIRDPQPQEPAQLLLPLVASPESWVGSFVVVGRDDLRTRPLLRAV